MKKAKNKKSRTLKTRASHDFCIKTSNFSKYIFNSRRKLAFSTILSTKLPENNVENASSARFLYQNFDFFDIFYNSRRKLAFSTFFSAKLLEKYVENASSARFLYQNFEFSKETKSCRKLVFSTFFSTKLPEKDVENASSAWFRYQNIEIFVFLIRVENSRIRRSSPLNFLRRMSKTRAPHDFFVSKLRNFRKKKSRRKLAFSTFFSTKLPEKNVENASFARFLYQNLEKFGCFKKCSLKKKRGKKWTKNEKKTTKLHHYF